MTLTVGKKRKIKISFFLITCYRIIFLAKKVSFKKFQKKKRKMLRLTNPTNDVKTD